MIEVFDAYDLAVIYDKPAGTLDLCVVLDSDPFGAPASTDFVRPTEDRSHISFIAGAGFERICATTYRYWSLLPIGPSVGNRGPGDP